jgi:hypothetical protein
MSAKTKGAKALQGALRTSKKPGYKKTLSDAMRKAAKLRKKRTPKMSRMAREMMSKVKLQRFQARLRKAQAQPKLVTKLKWMKRKASRKNPLRKKGRTSPHILRKRREAAIASLKKTFTRNKGGIKYKKMKRAKQKK